MSIPVMPHHHAGSEKRPAERPLDGLTGSSDQRNPREAGAAPVRSKPSTRTWLAVLSLSLGAFVLVTSEFLPVGLLPRVTSGLHVSLGLGGLMVLVPALSAAISAWALYAGARSINRRLLVAIFGSLVVLSNVGAAIAPDFAVLIVARIFLGLAIGGFWSVVPPIGPRLVGPGLGSKATTLIVSGVSVGTVIGLPAGQLLGNQVGWRWTFGIAAIVSAVAIAAEMLLLPSVRAASRTRVHQLVDVLRLPLTRSGLIVTLIAFIGQFAASTYVTPFLLDRGRIGTGAVSILLVAYGAAGVLGTIADGMLIARNRMWTWAGAAFGTGCALITMACLGQEQVAVGVMLIVWGFIWGAVPLSSQVWFLSTAGDHQEPASSVGVTTMQIAIAGGAALGGLLVDSAGLTTVFAVAGSIAVAAALIARVIGRDRRSGAEAGRQF
jgi:predicted MFS family arabinose efflux permease